MFIHVSKSACYALSPGTCDRYVETYELTSRSEDDGGDEESDQFRGAASRQLHRQDTGKNLPLWWAKWKAITPNGK